MLASMVISPLLLLLAPFATATTTTTIMITTTGNATGHSDHGHAGHGDGHSDPYEWAGIFETPDDTYTWIAQKVKGKYADASMKLVLLPSAGRRLSESDNWSKRLTALKAEGAESLEVTCSAVQVGAVLTPKADVCYQLMFDQDSYTSLFKINAKAVPAIAFFAEHVPTEFEDNMHYLKDRAGEDVEPLGELPVPKEAKEKERPWGVVILASIIVNVITLIGVVFLVPVVRRLATTYNNEFESLVSAFAAGALLACAFYLLLFEATHLIAVDYKKEVEVLWRWGTCVLAGFALPAVIDSSISGGASVAHPRQQAKSGDSVVPDPAGPADPADPETDKTKIQEDENKTKISRVRVAGGVLVGDFFHNLCDGFFLGAAFLGCGTTFGWTVAVATIAHEFAQELADFAILTGEQVKLSALLALALNFLSGTSVLLGAVIVLAMDISQSTIGMLLAFGGGVYIHIAATDCMPRIYSNKLHLLVRMICVPVFFVGAIGIGLVLLDHEHCVPAGMEDAHAGHGH